MELLRSPKDRLCESGCTLLKLVNFWTAKNQAGSPNQQQLATESAVQLQESAGGLTQPAEHLLIPPAENIAKVLLAKYECKIANFEDDILRLV